MDQSPSLRAALLVWYDAVRRDLPWRRHPSPWAVWVSEIMLQQTRVESVVGYFNRFMARYPTPAALAAAPQDEVLANWQGLGYYARARNLHKAAGQIVAQHGGEVPDDAEAFRALAGVGPYTCGAVQSIAFGRAVSAVDGNVIRVLSRLDRMEADPRRALGKRRIEARAFALAQGQRPGDLNQALMELGARCCTPRSPSCDVCPWRTMCQAHGAGVEETLPLKLKRKARRMTARAAALVWSDEGLWLGRRPEDGLLGGMWEPPAMDGGIEALALLGVEPTGASPVEIHHVFTHLEWTVRAWPATGTPRGEYTAYAQVPIAELVNYALTGPALKVLRAAGVPLPHRRGAGPR